MHRAECGERHTAYSCVECRVQSAECNRHHFAHEYVAACAYCIWSAAELACILKQPEHLNPLRSESLGHYQPGRALGADGVGKRRRLRTDATGERMSKNSRRGTRSQPPQVLCRAFRRSAGLHRCVILRPESIFERQIRLQANRDIRKQLQNQ